MSQRLPWTSSQSELEGAKGHTNPNRYIHPPEIGGFPQPHSSVHGAAIQRHSVRALVALQRHQIVHQTPKRSRPGVAYEPSGRPNELSWHRAQFCIAEWSRQNTGAAPFDSLSASCAMKPGSYQQLEPLHCKQFRIQVICVTSWRQYNSIARQYSKDLQLFKHLEPSSKSILLWHRDEKSTVLVINSQFRIGLWALRNSIQGNVILYCKQ